MTDLLSDDGLGQLTFEAPGHLRDALEWNRGGVGFNETGGTIGHEVLVHRSVLRLDPHKRCSAALPPGYRKVRPQTQGCPLNREPEPRSR